MEPHKDKKQCNHQLHLLQRLVITLRMVSTFLILLPYFIQRFHCQVNYVKRINTTFSIWSEFGGIIYQRVSTLDDSFRTQLDTLYDNLTSDEDKRQNNWEFFKSIRFKYTDFFRIDEKKGNFNGALLGCILKFTDIGIQASLVEVKFYFVSHHLPNDSDKFADTMPKGL